MQNSLSPNQTKPSFLLLSTILPLALFLCQCMVVDVESPVGSGIEVHETRFLASFRNINVNAKIPVTIQKGAEYSATLIADNNLTQYMHTSVWGNDLNIEIDYGLQTRIAPSLLITTPDLNSVIQNSSGTVEFSRTPHFEDLSLEINGNGSIYFSGSVDHLQTNLIGSGYLSVEGETDFLTGELNGNGEIHAENLLAQDADIIMRGGGLFGLDLDHHSTLKLNMDGPGKLEWWGNPEHLKYTIQGEGKIVEHRGLPKKTANAIKNLAAKIPSTIVSK